LTFSRMLSTLRGRSKWCLHGVHCEPEKSSLHPSPKTGTSWVASSFGWSYFGVNPIAKDISSSSLAYKRCAHLRHFASVLYVEVDVGFRRILVYCLWKDQC
jgi:hypothetical protein